MFRSLLKSASRHVARRQISKPSLFHRRLLTTWGPLDLPILPRVAFAHKEIKMALEKHKNTTSLKFAKEIDEKLQSVREVPWGKYNTTMLALADASAAQKKLQALIDLEDKLPVAIANELKQTAVFDSLRGAVACLDDRSNAPPASHIKRSFK